MTSAGLGPSQRSSGIVRRGRTFCRTATGPMDQASTMLTASHRRHTWRTRSGGIWSVTRNSCFLHRFFMRWASGGYQHFVFEICEDAVSNRRCGTSLAGADVSVGSSISRLVTCLRWESTGPRWCRVQAVLGGREQDLACDRGIGGSARGGLRRRSDGRVAPESPSPPAARRRLAPSARPRDERLSPALRWGVHSTRAHGEHPAQVDPPLPGLGGRFVGQAFFNRCKADVDGDQ